MNDATASDSVEI